MPAAAELASVWTAVSGVARVGLGRTFGSVEDFTGAGFPPEPSLGGHALALLGRNSIGGFIRSIYGSARSSYKQSLDISRRACELSPAYQPGPD